MILNCIKNLILCIQKVMNPKITILILNWNGWEDTIECLESLCNINYPDFNVILVDNASEDESIERIEYFCINKVRKGLKSRDYNFKFLIHEESEYNSVTSNDNEKWFNKELILLKNSKNYGYAKGNNIGMIFALRVFNPDYILLLNNDTVVEENFLTELIKATDNQGKVGIYSPKLLNYVNPKIIDSTGHVFRLGRLIDRGFGKRDKNQYDNKTKIIGAKGAAGLYKREMLQSIGLFKEDYVTSYEDAELSWRAYRHRWNAKYVPKSIVYHKGEKSITKDSKKVSYFRNLSLKNMTITVKEYGSNTKKVLFTFLIIYFMIGSYILRLTGIRNSGINYVKLLKKMLE